jgi:hypothetical protein
MTDSTPAVIWIVMFMCYDMGGLLRTSAGRERRKGKTNEIAPVGSPIRDGRDQASLDAHREKMGITQGEVGD